MNKLTPCASENYKQHKEIEGSKKLTIEQNFMEEIVAKTVLLKGPNQQEIQSMQTLRSGIYETSHNKKAIESINSLEIKLKLTDQLNVDKIDTAGQEKLFSVAKKPLSAA